jgi:curved DNA-binding protein CbpA
MKVNAPGPSGWGWNGPSMDTDTFDPYAALDIPATATQDQISHAYRRKLRAFHPDTRDASAPAPAADEQLRRIMAAYALLRDRARRAAFDRTAKPRASMAPTDWSSHPGPVRIPVRHGRQRWN